MTILKCFFMTARKKLAASSVLRAGLQANRCVARETGFYEMKKGTSYTRSVVEAPPRLELGIKVLQTSALPLGYGAKKELER